MTSPTQQAAARYSIKIAPTDSLGNIVGTPISGVWIAANATYAKQTALDEFGDFHAVIGCKEIPRTDEDFFPTQDANWQGENEPNDSWAEA
jgi:hypothetical protein